MRGFGGLLALIAAGSCLAAVPHAYADTNRNGNGSGNRNTFSIRSPTINHGQQIISNENAGGVNSSRNAFCKRQRVCRIHQAGLG